MTSQSYGPPAERQQNIVFGILVLLGIEDGTCHSLSLGGPAKIYSGRDWKTSGASHRHVHIVCASVFSDATTTPTLNLLYPRWPVGVDKGL